MRSALGLLSVVMLAGCASPPPKKISSTDSEHSAISVGSTLDCSKLVHYVRPVYPKEAKRKRIQGTVRLRAVITKTGAIRDFEVLNGDALLIPAALNAAKQWRYIPCIINSEAVDIVTTLDINFNLNR
jgi:TonB family protein